MRRWEIKIGFDGEILQGLVGLVGFSGFLCVFCGWSSFIRSIQCLGFRI